MLRWGWIGFGLSSTALGALLYGLALPTEPAYHVGPLVIGTAGAALGFVSMIHVVGFFSIGVLAGQLIPGRDLLPYAAHGAMPFYVASSFLRLVPTIRDDWSRIRLSQAARGHDLRRRWWRAAAYLPLLVPLFVSTVRRAREQTFALRIAQLSAPRRS